MEKVVKEYIDQFVQYLADVKKKSSNTILSVKSDLYKMTDYFETVGVVDVKRVNETQMNSYMLFLERNNMSTATISRYVSSMKSFFSYLIKNRIIDKEPTEQLSPPKVVKKTPKILTVEQVDLLLSQPDTTCNIGLRDKAMLEILYATGIKVTELMNLRISDVDSNIGFIVCHSGSSERRIPLGQPARQAILQYLKYSRGCLLKEKHGDVNSASDYLFVNYAGSPMSRQGFWKLIKQYGIKAKIEQELTPHILRNSFAAHIMQNGADLKSLQEMLGYSDIATTQIYSEFSNYKIRDIYKNTHPRS